MKFPVVLSLEILFKCHSFSQLAAFLFSEEQVKNVLCVDEMKIYDIPI